MHHADFSSHMDSYHHTSNHHTDNYHTSNHHTSNNHKSNNHTSNNHKSNNHNDKCHNDKHHNDKCHDDIPIQVLNGPDTFSNKYSSSDNANDEIIIEIDDTNYGTIKSINNEYNKKIDKDDEYCFYLGVSGIMLCIIITLIIIVTLFLV